MLAVAVALLAGACGSSKSTSSPTTAKSIGTGVTSGSSNSTSTAGGIGNSSSPVTLNESGSTLLYPFLQELVAPLHQAYSNITLAPGPGGSGKGISDAASGVTQFGGSDAYLSPGQMQKYPGLLNIPIAVSAQAVNYNLSGISNLKLDGNILALIYEGKITKWNDSAIAALNPGVNLPATTIVPLRRIDASGDTFIFTSLLTKTNPAWASGPAFNTSVNWPAVPGELTANGNPGMVQTCQATPGCVAYVGVSSEAAAKSAGLGEVMLQNKSGNFVQPTAATEEAAVAASTGNVPANLAVSLIYSSGADAYPIINFEYIVVQSKQANPTTAEAVRTFLTFAISPTQGSQTQYLAKEDFVGLPASVLPKVQAAIAKIG
ncbi:MAG: phosphate ABC transporter substrate-binding protein PstS [Acidimicrobiales bacterium]